MKKQKEIKKIPFEENWAKKLDLKTFELLKNVKSGISSKLKPKSDQDKLWESITDNIGKKDLPSAPLPLGKIIPKAKPDKANNLLTKAKNVKSDYIRKIKLNADMRKKNRLELQTIEASSMNEFAVEKMKGDIRMITLKTLSKLEKNARGRYKEDIIRTKKKLRKH